MRWHTYVSVTNLADLDRSERGVTLTAREIAAHDGDVLDRNEAQTVGASQCPRQRQQTDSALHLSVAPIAITFASTFADAEASPFDPSVPMPELTADGRAGRVPAGCVFPLSSSQMECR